MNQIQSSTQSSQNPDSDHVFVQTRIAFIQSCWHKEIVDQSREAFVKTLSYHGTISREIDFFEVPGSLEIPLQSKFLAQSRKYSIIIAAGLITNGGIYRHEFVAQAVISAMMQVQLETMVPIISIVLTPHHFHKHQEHHDFFYDHMKTKGTEAALACIKTIENLNK